MVGRRAPLGVPQLGKALLWAIAMHAELNEHSDGVSDFISRYKWRAVPRALEVLAEILGELTTRNVSTDPESLAELLAEVAIVISLAAPKADGPDAAREDITSILNDISTDWVVGCAACLASFRRHSIPMKAFPVGDILQALEGKDRPRLIQAFRQSLGLAQTPGLPGQAAAQPVPRGYIATPLTHLDERAHRQVMHLSALVSRHLRQLGMVAISPDPGLTPSSVTDSPRDYLSQHEQLLIAGSDLVVAIGAEHGSWGVSRSVSWAEGCCSVAVVTSTTPGLFVSRVLDSTPHRTFRLDADENPEVLLGKLTKLLRQLRPVIGHHAQDRLDMSRRVEPVLTRLNREVSGPGQADFGSSLMTPARAADLMGNPVLINQSSMAEMRAMRRALGPQADAVIDSVLDRAPLAREGSMDTARELSGKSYANLQSVAQLEGWSSGEVLKLIDAHLHPVVRPEVAYHSRTVTGDDWKRLYKWQRRLG